MCVCEIFGALLVEQGGGRAQHVIKCFAHSFLYAPTNKLGSLTHQGTKRTSCDCQTYTTAQQTVTITMMLTLSMD